MGFWDVSFEVEVWYSREVSILLARLEMNIRIDFCRGDWWSYKENFGVFHVLAKSKMGKRIEDRIFGNVPIWWKEEGEVNKEEEQEWTWNCRTQEVEKMFSRFPLPCVVPEDKKRRNKPRHFYSLIK